LHFEKTTLVPAPVDDVWKLLLDPEAMIACVPGVEKIEALTATDYLVSMHVKISFISARFRVRTSILEMKPPLYLRSCGSGQDSTLTSSLKIASELFLAERASGTTEIRTVLDVELLGRLGTFGLNVVKTKADRMWEEFGRNLTAKVEA
jgi:carbon monoxide dehydrogenase subunit G